MIFAGTRLRAGFSFLHIDKIAAEFHKNEGKEEEFLWENARNWGVSLDGAIRLWYSLINKMRGSDRSMKNSLIVMYHMCRMELHPAVSCCAC